MPRGPSDSQCPLGFHPQVRFPNRCKRCFRDFTAHADKKKQEAYLLATGSDPHGVRSTVSASRFEEPSYSRRGSYTRSSSFNVQDDVPPLPPESNKKKEEEEVPSCTLSVPGLNEADSRKGDRESRPTYRRSVTELALRGSSSSQESRSPRRLKIQSMKEVRSIDEPDNQEVSFILKVSSEKSYNDDKPHWQQEGYDPEGNIDTLSPSERGERDDLKVKVSSLQKDISNLTHRCDDLQREKVELERKIGDGSQSREVKKLEDKIDELTRNKQIDEESKRSELEKLNLRCQELEKEKDTLSRRKRTKEEMKQSEIDKLREKVDLLEKEKEEAFNQKKRVEESKKSELEKLSQKCQDLERERTDSSKRIRREEETRSRELEELKRKLEQTEKEKEDLRKKRRQTEDSRSQENEELKSKVGTLEKALEEVNRKRKQMEMQSELDVKELKDKLKRVEESLSEKTKQSEAYKSDIRELDERHKREISDTKRSVEESREKRERSQQDQTNAELRNWKERCEALEKENGDLMRKCRAEEAKRTSEVGELTKKLEDLQKQKASAEKPMRDGTYGPKVKKELEELRAKCESLTHDNEGLKDKVTSLEQARSDENSWKAKCQDLQRDIEELLNEKSESLKNRDAEIKELRIKCNDLQKENEEKQKNKNVTGLNSEMDDLKKRIKILEKERDNKVEEYEKRLNKEKEENQRKLKLSEKYKKQAEQEKEIQEEKVRNLNDKIKEFEVLKIKSKDLETKIDESRKVHKDELNSKQVVIDKLEMKCADLESQKKTIEKSKQEEYESSQAEIKSLREKCTQLNVQNAASDISKSKQNEVKEWRTKYEKLEKEHNKIDIQMKEDKDKFESEVSLLTQEIQQMKIKISSLETANKDLFTTNKSLESKVTSLEKELETPKDKEPTSLFSRRRHSSEDSEKQDLKRQIEDLKGKLNAAETLCEELMDENEEFKKDIRDMEEEIEEMQDNFREDQADEYHSLKKELEQTAKNCRVLQFKLRKAERKTYETESDKMTFNDKFSQRSYGDLNNIDIAERALQLEQELNMAREVSLKMNQEIEMLRKQQKMFEGDKSISKLLTDTIGDNRDILKRDKNILRDTIPVSRNIPGGEDTSNLLRDLQDTIEREQDTREQLKYAEEEANLLRKQLNRVEEENETLVLQLKKMANAKSRGKRFGRSSSLESEPNVSIDSGMVEEQEDCNPAEMKLQLELHEQECSVLRRKVEELEGELDRVQGELKDLNEKYSKLEKDKGKSFLKMTKGEGSKETIIVEQKLKIMEEEANELRKKLIERERDVERLELEIQQSSKSRKGSKVILPRSRSLENDPQSVDLRRQLQLVEQEATILRTKTRQLEDENDKLATENRKLTFRVGRKPPPTDMETAVMEKIELEEKLKRIEKQLSEAESRAGLAEYESSSQYSGGKSTGFYELEVLRTERDSLQKGVQMRDDELLHLRMKITELERQKTELEIRIDRAKLTANYKSRTARKTKETATRQDLRKQVDELELEIGELCVVIKNLAEENENIIKDIDFKNNDAKQMKIEIEELNIKHEQELVSLSDRIESLTADLKTEKNKVELFNREKKCLEEEIARNDKESYNLKIDVEVVTERIEVLKADLEAEKQGHQQTKERLLKVQSGDSEAALSFDDLRKAEQEKHRLQKEVFDMESRLIELERRFKDSEDLCKCMDKENKDLSNQITALDCELSDVKSKLADVAAESKELEKKLEKERADIRKEKAESKKQLLKQENEYEEKIRVITSQKANESIEEDKKVTNIKKKYEQELKALKESQSTYKTKAADAESKLSKLEKDLKNWEEKKKRLELEITKLKEEKQAMTSKLGDVELQLKTELKKKDRSEKEYGTTLRSKEEEITKLKEKLKKIEAENKSMSDKIRDNFHAKKLKELEATLEREKHYYSDLTKKYEQLEDDYVGTKTKMVMEKEQVQGDYSTLKRDHDFLVEEIKSLKDTFNYRQESWVKEKIELQERVKEQEGIISRSSNKGAEAERARLKSIIEERSSSIEEMKRVEDERRNEINSLNKQIDELKRKLHDFGRVQKFKERTNSVETYCHEDDVKELKEKFQKEARTMKAEITHLRIQHDSELAILKEEAAGLQLQVGKFRRERDTYKQMLDGAQRTIADLKAGNVKKGIVSDNVELLAAKEKLNTMHQQMNALEDRLADAKLDTVRAETDLATERATWQIKISELTTKINELEEFKLLSSGRSKLSGVKTKLELAWQKERDDQLKLINETANTNKEMRHQLVEMEKERARERIDAKRDLEKLKQTMEVEQEEVRRKVTELQRDLLDLRDSHARLRSINEKLRREKERLERDKQAYREYVDDVKKVNEEEATKVRLLLDTVQKVVESNELEPRDAEDKGKKRKGKDGVSPLSDTLKLLSTRSEEIQSILKRRKDIQDSDRKLRQEPTTMRSSSVEGDSKSTLGFEDSPKPKKSHFLAPKSRFFGRKAASVENRGDQDLDSKGSSQSIGTYGGRSYSTESETGDFNVDRDRDPSLDRISTQSEIITSDKDRKKKTSLRSKLKSLTKSRSIEDSHTADYIATAGVQALAPGIGHSNIPREKKDLKDKFSRIFSKSKSSLRSQSLDRHEGNESDTGSMDQDSISDTKVRIPKALVSGIVKDRAGMLRAKVPGDLQPSQIGSRSFLGFGRRAPSTDRMKRTDSVESTESYDSTVRPMIIRQDSQGSTTSRTLY